MPAYEYECQACKGRTMVRHGVNEPALRRHWCETCQKRTAVKRVFSVSSIHFSRASCSPSGG